MKLHSQCKTNPGGPFRPKRRGRHARLQAMLALGASAALSCAPDARALEIHRPGHVDELQAEPGTLMQDPEADAAEAATAASAPVVEPSAAAPVPLELPPTKTVQGADAKPHLEQFKLEGELRKNVEFWTGIYTRYTTRQGLIHDSRYIDRVYEVIELDANPRRAKHQVKDAKAHWKKVLQSLHRKAKSAEFSPASLSGDEAKVYALFADLPELKKSSSALASGFADATSSKRMRFQLGQSDRFREGLRQSGIYLPHMEAIFAQAGLPIELTRLPFVESSFNLRARSKVGATGIWQFMRGTGRLFLKMNRAVDERNDPLRATEAAARFLRQNYEKLGTWPLAVTAYNHGPAGIQRAVQKVGSPDLQALVDQYKSRSFGFASTNFFACLLAAIEVERNAEKYFGPIQRESALSHYEVEIPAAVPAKELMHFMKVDVAVLREYNPGLTEAALRSQAPLPAGYRLRLPLATGHDPNAESRIFLAGFNEIPKLYKSAEKRPKYDRPLATKKR